MPTTSPLTSEQDTRLDQLIEDFRTRIRSHHGHREVAEAAMKQILPTDSGREYTWVTNYHLARPLIEQVDQSMIEQNLDSKYKDDAFFQALSRLPKASQDWIEAKLMDAIGDTRDLTGLYLLKPSWSVGSAVTFAFALCCREILEARYTEETDHCLDAFHQLLGSALAVWVLPNSVILCDKISA